LLDDRIPAASDLPMTEPVMAELPKPRRLYGVKAEVHICPPSAAIGKAVKPATGWP
jgi:CO/xanthine dehydrogenase Mo-binding subunit